MPEYRQYELGSVCARLSSGKGIPASQVFNEGAFPVYGGNGLRGYTDHSNFRGDCAIIGRQGAFCGNVRYFNGEAYMTEHAVVVCANECHNTRYLAYLLSQMNLGRLSGQSAQPGLSVKTLAKQVIELPPLDVQNKVVAVLSSLDSKIALNEKINDNLEEQVKCIFNNEYAPNLYRKGWTVSTIGDVVTLQRGYDLPKDKMTLGIYPVAGSTDTIFYHNNYTTDAPCIVIGRSGNIGKPRLYMEKCWAHNTTLFVKDFKGNNPYWVYYMLCSIDYSQFQGGSAVPTLNRNYVHAFEIAIPPANQQNEFAEKILPFLLQIKSNQAEIYTLSKIRDALLPRLMSGEIDVSAVQL